MFCGGCPQFFHGILYTPRASPSRPKMKIFAIFSQFSARPAAPRTRNARPAHGERNVAAERTRSGFLGQPFRLAFGKPPPLTQGRQDKGALSIRRKQNHAFAQRDSICTYLCFCGKVKPPRAKMLPKSGGEENHAVRRSRARGVFLPLTTFLFISLKRNV